MPQGGLAGGGAESTPGATPVEASSHCRSSVRTATILTSMKVRLAVVVSHPIQHFAPWHREVAKQARADLRVFFCCDWGVADRVDPDFGRAVRWDVDLTEEYDHEFLSLRRPISERTFWSVDNPGMSEALDAFSPHVVFLFGYMFRSYWRAALWARRNGVPLMLYSDANHARRRPRHVQLAKEVVVRGFYRLVDGAFAVGDNNRAYHRYYGIPDDRLFDGMLPIDRQRLLASVKDRAAARKEVRERHGVPEEALVAIWLGKFIPRKRARDVLEAARDAARRRLPFHAVMIGEGPEREGLERFVRESGLDNVTFTGFVNQSRIPEYLAASDLLLVTSSDDPHPLVVTEAAAFGLPCVVSNAIGCVGPTDTARPDVNALVYPCSDTRGLLDAIERLWLEPALRRRMGSAAEEIAESQDARVAAARLVDAVERLYQLGKR